MSLNDIIARLQADTVKQPKTCAPPQMPPELWNLYRAIWQIEKRLKCSRCIEALERRCVRGKYRKTAHKEGRPCFQPAPTLLAETEAIVNQCLTTLTTLTAK